MRDFDRHYYTFTNKFKSEFIFEKLRRFCSSYSSNYIEKEWNGGTDTNLGSGGGVVLVVVYSRSSSNL